MRTKEQREQQLKFASLMGQGRRVLQLPEDNRVDGVMTLDGETEATDDDDDSSFDDEFDGLGVEVVDFGGVAGQQAPDVLVQPAPIPAPIDGRGVEAVNVGGGAAGQQAPDVVVQPAPILAPAEALKKSALKAELRRVEWQSHYDHQRSRVQAQIDQIKSMEAEWPILGEIRLRLEGALPENPQNTAAGLKNAYKSLKALKLSHVEAEIEAKKALAKQFLETNKAGIEPLYTELSDSIDAALLPEDRKQQLRTQVNEAVGKLGVAEPAATAANAAIEALAGIGLIVAAEDERNRDKLGRYEAIVAVEFDPLVERLGPTYVEGFDIGAAMILAAMPGQAEEAAARFDFAEAERILVEYNDTYADVAGELLPALQEKWTSCKKIARRYVRAHKGEANSLLHKLLTRMKEVSKLDPADVHDTGEAITQFEAAEKALLKVGKIKRLAADAKESREKKPFTNPKPQKPKRKRSKRVSETQKLEKAKGPLWAKIIDAEKLLSRLGDDFKKNLQFQKSFIVTREQLAACRTQEGLAVVEQALDRRKGRLEAYLKQNQPKDTRETAKWLQDELWLQAHLLEGPIGKMGSSLDQLEAVNAKRKLYEPLFKSMTAERKKFEVLSKSTSVTVLKAALEDVARLKSQVYGAIAAMDGNPNAYAFTLETAQAALNKLEKRLMKKDLQKYMVVTWDELTERLAKIRKTLGAKGLNALESRIEALSAAVAALERDAAAGKKEFESYYREQLAWARAELKRIPRRTAQRCVKEAEKRIDILQTNAMFEETRKNRTAWSATLDELVAWITQVADDSAAEENKLAVAEQEEAKASIKLNARVTQIQGEIAKAKSLSAKEKKSLGQQLSSIRDVAKKSGDYDVFDQVEDIRARVALVEQNPVGLAIAGRNQLPKVNREYVAALDGLTARILAIGKKIQGLPAADFGGGAEQAKLVDSLNGLLRMFDKRAFDRTIEAMQTKREEADTKDQKRAAQREKGLREARRMKAMLEDDYRFRVLGKEPFVTGTASVISRLMLALLNVENNLLISL